MHYLKSFRNFVQKVNFCLGNQNVSSIYNSNFKPFLKSQSPSILIMAEKKTIAEELGLPEPPKKPMVPYVRYLTEESKKFPNIKSSDKFVKIGESWRSLGEAAKSKYADEYNNELESYKQKLNNYTESLTPDQLEEIKILKVKKRMEKEEAALKRKKRKDNDMQEKPKHPGNSFNLFIESLKNKRTLPKDMNVILFARDKWQELPEVQKDSFREEAKQLLLHYKEQLSEWENKMLAKGRAELVRKSTLTAIRKSTPKVK